MAHGSLVLGLDMSPRPTAAEHGTARSIALVLSGGGARGAYAVGVVAGLHEVLGGLRGRFDVVTGTSVGAINAAHLVAHADEDDLGAAELQSNWSTLHLPTHLRPHIRHRQPLAADHGWALLDPRPLRKLVLEELPWDRVHANIASGRIRALLASALRIRDGRTVTFGELAPGTGFAATHDPRRDARIGRVTGDEVLASAALPLLFQAQRIDDTYYCDGGLRFNTPIAPAIRVGAQDLVVIALRTGRPAASDDIAVERYPRPLFLLGKVLDALLLDPVDYDLQVLARFNALLEIMEEAVPPEALDRIRAVVAAERGLPYRRVRSLVFRPSQDIGVLAGEYLSAGRRLHHVLSATDLLLRHVAFLGAHMEADFISYLLFDGEFARLLIDLGRHDVLDRAGEVRAFFGEPSRIADEHAGSITTTSPSVDAPRPTSASGYEGPKTSR